MLDWGTGFNWEDSVTYLGCLNHCGLYVFNLEEASFCPWLKDPQLINKVKSISEHDAVILSILLSYTICKHCIELFEIQLMRIMRFINILEIRLEKMTTTATQKMDKKLNETHQPSH